MIDPAEEGELRVTICHSESPTWRGKVHACRYRAGGTSKNPAALRNSGPVRFLGFGFLFVFVIPLIPELFACGGQVVCVFRSSFADNLGEELQVNIRAAERSAYGVGPMILTVFIYSFIVE